jgi:hypothetical protein
VNGERSFLDRFLAAIPYAIGVLAVLGLLFWQASARKTPTIFTDELEWSQLSRAIAATGHAARRGESFDFKSLYAFLIAPAWWITATGSAYAAIKYLNAILMTLAAVPTYLIARTMVSTRAAFVVALAACCTTAIYYAGFILPEVAAYPTFVFCAWLSIRALSGGGRWWIVGAIVADLLAAEVRGELIVLPAAFALAAAVLWVVGPRGRHLRRNWGFLDHVGAALLLIGAFIVVNRIISPHAQQWTTVTQSWQGRLWSLGLNAASALAIGLGLLPFVGGLASLWIPERKNDPSWRAFASFTGAAIVTVWLYTAVKAAYLSTIFATRVEERNLIYLGPLLLIGTAVWLSSRIWLPGLLAAWGLTAFLVIHYGYQLDYPYFEAPGYGIAAMANRAWHWNQSDIRTGFVFASIVLLVLLLVVWAKRTPTPAKRVALILVVVGGLTWMLAGEITSSRGAARQSNTYATNLPKPLDWVDRATNRDAATFIGQDIDSGQALGVNLLEFWNRSIKHVYSLDGSAPGPGPTLTPDLVNRFGILSHDPGLPYVVTTDGVNLVGSFVDKRPGLTVRRIDRHPWALQEATYGVSNDGWISGSTEDPEANGTWAYFGPQRTPGTVTVAVARRGFCSKEAPGTHATVRIGPLELNEQHAPRVARAAKTVRFALPNCGHREITLRIAPPVAVQVHVSPTIRPSDYGASDNRELGAQVGFKFTPSR